MCVFDSFNVSYLFLLVCVPPYVYICVNIYIYIYICIIYLLQFFFVMLCRSHLVDFEQVFVVGRLVLIRYIVGVATDVSSKRKLVR